MSPAQYAAAIERLGMSQRAAARFLGVNERTSRAYALGESRVPAMAAKLLRVMIKHGLVPSDAD